MTKDIDIFLFNIQINSYMTKFDSVEEMLQDFFSSSADEVEILKKSFRLIFSIESLESQINFIKYAWHNIDESRTQFKLKFVGTLPQSSHLTIRRTLPVVEDMIADSKSEFIITGYSITDYSDAIFQLLKEKAENGVLVYLFIDDKDALVKQISGLEIAQNSLIKVFRYDSKKNNNGSFHAKVIIADYSKALISSSNLSYRGFVKNVELGVFIEGKEIRKLRDTMFRMLEQGYFKEISL